MDVFDPEVPDIDFDPDSLRAHLKAWARHVLSLPRKANHGYLGSVIPLGVWPLVVGLGKDGHFKLMDIREAIDDSPDQCWHDWLKITGAELAPDVEGQPREREVKIRAEDILRAVTGGQGGVPELVTGILRRIIR